MFKKLLLVGIGLLAAIAFIGFDAVGLFVDKTRSHIRSHLTSPEMDLQQKLSEARELSERCADSVIKGRVALSRLDSMIADRQRDLARRETMLERDQQVLRTRRALLQDGRKTYLISNERVSRRTLNRDALLRARSFATDREIYDHLAATLDELRAARVQTGAEIEDAMSEQVRLEGEVTSLKAELENLKARRAVAQTREEAAYVFDRSTFDEARDKIAEIRATIAEQNKRLDFYKRHSTRGKGLIPADVEMADESGVQAIDELLGVDPVAEVTASVKH